MMRPNFITAVPTKAAKAPAQANWPFAVKWIAKRRQAGDVGVGDTVERLFARAGADRLAKAYERISGHACRCQNRKAWLNSRYPYAALNGV